VRVAVAEPCGPPRGGRRVRSLCLECSMRLPGYGRTGTPANDDAPIVVKVVWLLSGSVGAGWRVGCC